MFIHIVRQGETFASIAENYGIPTARLIVENGAATLQNPVVGQALLILQAAAVHTVLPGETLYSIAQSYGITLVEILQRNPDLILNPTVYPGQQIVIIFAEQGQKPLEIYGYTYPFVAAEITKKQLPYLTACAIFSYGFRSDGSLIEIDDQSLINQCYFYQTAPVFLLSSIDESGGFSSAKAKELFNNLPLQNTVIDNMINTMLLKGYTGVDIDFEYVNAEDKGAFVNFIYNVAEKMHRRGFTVNVDLAPKTSAEQKGLLYEGHDYKAIGEIADTVLLMTYEWGYAYGPPMAVAPLPRVEQVVRYAVSEIPPEKIYMGIPNYGYDWRLPYRQGERAYSIGNEEALQIAAANNAVIQYDETAQSPYFEYTAETDYTNHIVWFEDIRSIQAKYGLIDKYGLRGGGYWNLRRPFMQGMIYPAYQYDIKKNVPR